MKVIISAGGTGGHIYPVLAIMDKIQEMEKDSQFLYVGTHNRMESEVIPKMGIKYETLVVTGFKRKITTYNFKSIYYFFSAIKKSKKIIKEFKPDIVVGAGGYVTAPIIYAAKKLGVKTFIHEQNSVVGLSNKFLSKYASAIGVSFKNTVSVFPKEKVYYTGNPCSEKALKIPSAKKSDYGLSKNKKLVLIVMGSLGSKSINKVMMETLPKFDKKKYEVIYVTGKNYYNEVKKVKIPSNVLIFPFIPNITSLMKITDLMISRAGASTISEITSLEIPTIFIPSPYVPSNHQYLNALDLVNQQAGFLLEEKDLTSDKLIKDIDSIINDNSLLETTKKNLSQISIKDSSTKIYKIIKDLVNNDK
ncbi:MAG: undecaprenyldiphospho-muramoylpentapeptide beta-N-acetylglucosaminyltransferase [bacterium]|nr:undecaprenyldiphospho-muramoylpentapeptide beta-N-acetylglucosaminyltransferase [bacterium]